MSPYQTKLCNFIQKESICIQKNVILYTIVGELLEVIKIITEKNLIFFLEDILIC